MDVINKADKTKGKIIVNGNVYYYLWGKNNSGSKNLILTDNRQIKQQAKELVGIILPTMVATVGATIVLLFTWSQYVLSKIKKLQEKTKSLITGKEVNGNEFIIDDELNELNTTIEEVNKELKKKDEYKNMMFQNLSHELKTPISVIRSYIEGVQDGVVDKDEAIKVIAEENDMLYKQVNTILQINKIDYMKDSKKYTNSMVDIIKVLNSVVEKHRQIKPDLNFNITIKENSTSIMYKGTEDMWKAVFDNILGNFIRYAKENITVVIDSDKIILENDGEKIEEAMLEKIFLPYVKGKNGQSGLGLSIVKKTVNIFGYDINVKNLDNGVRFVIK
jgi:two-component system sensor histidine kinase CssS